MKTEIPPRMVTHSGLCIDLENITPRDLRISDIAHSLSLLCRFGGHCSRFWSVAAHCLICCRQANMDGMSSMVQFGCLLHDAAEAYWQDLGAPHKRCQGMEGYVRRLELTQELIYNSFGAKLNEEERCQVKYIDLRVLAAEASLLMRDKGKEWLVLENVEPAQLTYRDVNWLSSPKIVENMYINEFSRLYAEVNEEWN